MKIVKFEDGFYGIRKFSIFYFRYVYLDIKSRGGWWRPRKSEFFLNSCKNDDLEHVKKCFAMLKDKGTPI